MPPHRQLERRSVARAASPIGQQHDPGRRRHEPPPQPPPQLRRPRTTPSGSITTRRNGHQRVTTAMAGTPRAGPARRRPGRRDVRWRRRQVGEADGSSRQRNSQNSASPSTEAAARPGERLPGRDPATCPRSAPTSRSAASRRSRVAAAIRELTATNTSTGMSSTVTPIAISREHLRVGGLERALEAEQVHVLDVRLGGHGPFGQRRTRVELESRRVDDGRGRSIIPTTLPGRRGAISSPSGPASTSASAGDTTTSPTAGTRFTPAGCGEFGPVACRRRRAHVGRCAGRSRRTTARVGAIPATVSLDG